MIAIGQRAIEVAGRRAPHARAESLTQGAPMHADYVLVQNHRHLIMPSLNVPKGDFAHNEPRLGHIIANLPFCADAAAPGHPRYPPPAPALKRAHSTMMMS